MKTISKLHQYLQKQIHVQIKLDVSKKMEKELNKEIAEEDCHSMLVIQLTSTSSCKWREFGWNFVLIKFLYIFIFKTLLDVPFQLLVTQISNQPIT